ncbi:MAG TPA: S8 family serine peptidase, partial [Candidatus Paceibacterota bacterium]|nr:S8 family serine peptidase [Candidatus Paceibacterota bacterium]
MSTKKALVFLIFSSFLLVGGFAHAAVTSNNRYFVQSTSAFWEKSFQARNIFSSGFTADLSDWQLRLASLFGIKTQPIGELNILASKSSQPVVTSTKADKNQVDWGVKDIYGDSQADLPSGGEGVTVAILDTGVDSTHSDLKDRIAGCEDFTGFSSVIDNQCADGNGHGTHVAGIVAADGGNIGNGIYGVAPEADLLILKVCSKEGSCYADDVAAGIRYATDAGANIILISAGSNTDSALIDDALDYASSNGVMVITAAGNDGPYEGG